MGSKKPVYIYLFGAQNGGKSTQMFHLAQQLIGLGYRTMAGFQIPERTDGSISRRALSKGFIINETSDFDTQYDICLSYSLFDFETRKKAVLDGYDFVVLDRTMLDHLLYCWRCDNISIEDKTAIAQYALGHAERNPADYGWLVEPIPTLTADGQRSTNKAFQDEMHNMFVEYIIKRKIGDRIIEQYFKNLNILPYSEGFSKEESLRMRSEMVIERLRKDGRI